MLESYWYIAAKARALRRAPQAIRLFSRNLVLFRDAKGQPHCVEDRCAHRNMPLSAGQVTADGIQCPYHGWTYNGAGEATRVPVAPTLPCNLRISAFPCCEQDGYIWVCPSDKPAVTKPLRFPYLHEPGWTSFHMKTRFQGTVEACLENFLDCPHATFVHKYWFRAPVGRAVKAVVRALEDGAEAEFFEEPRERSVVWSTLSPAKATMRHTDRFIAPATSRVDYHFSNGRGYVITSSCTPVTDTETEVYTVISFRYGPVGLLVRAFFEPLSRLIIWQDVRALRAQQKNIERFGGPRFKVIPQDLLLPHIRRWRNDLAQGHTPETKGEKTVDLLL